ncbi:ubiquinone biosynthesis regulatory protein kinase UbiB [Glaesserella parasuis]|uniref:ubiquinone biosynthesis regulatory protein kinase UbiB n=1 Tax=Glaesserella parasuis TaxID=738 RepID=UPI00094F4ADE|nr:ubiquinone biosynthesis regulatory protein kinase UbiB [Glaesserella parasuis]MDP0150230.1 ubiquinone biosynthesis regulatory protein kinase UbiB [Glaesserella parasuis]MWQ28808.1 ubiquinone biosynthesis regulatory protein kinase UbiB [Glaesserella parasuis]MWQ35180.1 ubiquinone biosynthesis regulatory protein kinase UbiB [Glaesserella parasuis]MWQ43186.1 ubiquinone biosynthesis regulatory protein kinase UbiB [Glaesserella parasuis]MWQ49115.1 ubiquinone biosynthesis regulatory protein kinas
MNIKNLRRLYHIIHTFLRYGIDEVIPDIPLTRGIRCGRKSLFWVKNQYPNEPFGVRLRLALQELGPVWIKLGQMLSTRRDLFEPELADQLALLQDSVEAFDGKLARRLIEEALGDKLEKWFDDFDETALASASIAQVHIAKFNQNQPLAGKEVVLKVLRPEIERVIKDDLALMYRLASWIPRLNKEGRRLRPVEVVREYEKTLLDELDLRKEMANAIRLRNNFENSEMLYVPEMYQDFCHKNVIVMERIYGIPVANIDELKANGTDMKLLAERGVQVFFTQVFRDSFFHADMHPGNIFVNPNHPENPQYIGIDCGIVGTLNQNDKRYLAESFVAFFNRDYRRVALMHVESGWTPADTDIDAFEEAFREVCEPIFAKPLSEISFGHVLLNLFTVARKFNMEVQPQLVLLQKTLLYIEGLGRQVYPQLDLWQTAKPFLQDWLNEQVGFKAMWRDLKQRAPQFREHFAEFPEAMFQALQQQKQINFRLNEINQSLKAQRNNTGFSRLMILGIAIAGTFWKFETLPLWVSVPLLVIEFRILIWCMSFSNNSYS